MRGRGERREDIPKRHKRDKRHDKLKQCRQEKRDYKTMQEMRKDKMKGKAKQVTR